MTFDWSEVPDDHYLIASISISELEAQGIDPFSTPPWQGIDRPILPEEIEAAVSNGQFEERPVNAGSFLENCLAGKEYEVIRATAFREHVGRIAFLAEEPRSDPIWIAVGTLDCLALDVHDGWHRIAAAMIRSRRTGDDASVDAVFDGDPDAILHWFPTATFRLVEIENSSEVVPSAP